VAVTSLQEKNKRNTTGGGQNIGIEEKEDSIDNIVN